jgi:hypothetical protein
MGTPSRYPSGVSTSPAEQVFGALHSPNPVRDHVYSNDWDQYVPGDWTITTTTGSNALQVADGGVMRLSTAASGSDIQSIRKLPAAFKFTAGSQLWFAVLLNVATNATSVCRAGLMTGGTDLIPTDGVYFSKAAAGVWEFNMKVAGATTTLSNIATAVDGAYLALGFYYDGKATPTMNVFSSSGMTLPTAVGNFNNSGGRYVVATGVMTNLPASILAPTLALQTSTAAIRTMDIDYMVAANEVNRF